MRIIIKGKTKNENALITGIVIGDEVVVWDDFSREWYKEGIIACELKGASFLNNKSEDLSKAKISVRDLESVDVVSDFEVTEFLLLDDKAEVNSVVSVTDVTLE